MIRRASWREPGSADGTFHERVLDAQHRGRQSLRHGTFHLFLPYVAALFHANGGLHVVKVATVELEELDEQDGETEVSVGGCVARVQL